MNIIKIKNISKVFTLTVLILAVACNCSFAAGKKEQGSTVYKPAAGGYTLTIPAQSKRVFHTTTGVRFVTDNQLLVSADVYSMPNFISVPMKNYSYQQSQDFEKFLLSLQDYPDLAFVQDKIQAQAQTTAGNIAAQGMHSRTPLETVDKKLQDKADKEAIKSPVLKLNETECDFTLKPTKKMDMPKDYITGRAYQLRNDKLLVVRVSAPTKNAASAAAALNAITDTMKISKPKYPDDNQITAEILGYKLDMPFGWHAYTLKADNMIMVKSLSSVHNDEGMLRAFKTTAYADFANAAPANLKQATDAFIDKVTKYRPNVSVVKHEGFIADGVNGCLVEATDSDNLKKMFIVNGYLFSKDGYGYQIRFSTDDTINYDIKLHSFISAIKSFKRVK